MVNDDIIKTLPVVNTFWKKLKKHLSDKTFTLEDWKILLYEHKRENTIIPPDILDEFLDEVTTVQRETLHPLMTDILFNLLKKKYKEKQSFSKRRGKLYRYLKDKEI